MKHILCVVGLLVLCSVLNAAETKPKNPKDPKETKTDAAEEKTSAAESFVFTRVERRDPFYSAIATVEAKKAVENFRLEQMNDDEKQENKELEPAKGPETDPTLDPVRNALAAARYRGKRASLALLDGNWDITISETDEGLNALRKIKVPPQFVKEVNAVVLQLNGLRNTAQEAKLNEEAEAKFNALKLEVQGIMWSADKRSMAIISGEAYFVQDKIGENEDAVTIVNIDPNRVDFMINHQRKRFEFKRYINN